MADVLVLIMLLVFIVLCIQIARLIFADADLKLLWAARFGKKKNCLKDKVVWVTGASSGIGEHLVYELVRAGCKLILSARQQDQLERVKKQCLLTGNIAEEDILVLPLDILQFDSHQEGVDKAFQHFKCIDILVNNAGRSQRAFIKDTDLQVDRDMMDLNFIGTISLTKLVLPHMIEQKQGHLVFTSSIAGKIGAPNSASYSASKFALQGWCETARVELSPYNIAVTTICPGPVFSGVQANAFTGKVHEKHGVSMQKSERRMSTERCAHLMAVAIANRLDEIWVSLQPVLLITYVAQYMPSTYTTLAKILGKNMTLIKKLRSGGSLRS